LASEVSFEDMVIATERPADEVSCPARGEREQQLNAIRRAS
jgi:hypothetical protein